jgi:uncharacterized membrane protein
VAQQTIEYSDLPVQYMNTRTRDGRSTTVNVRIEYRWKSWMAPYLQVWNLFNASSSQTINGYSRLATDTYRPIYEVGIRGRF